MTTSVLAKAAAYRAIDLATGCCRLISFSMKSAFSVFVCAIIVGCSPPPSKEAHIKQVEREIAQAGGESNIVAESRTLFRRLSSEAQIYGREDRCFEGLHGITNLGDVFIYEPDYIHIRIHNSHFDTYIIELLNPDRPQPEGFQRIAGNVGFLERGGAMNRSQPVRPETNRTSAAGDTHR
jgi:hypothetical protein